MQAPPQTATCTQSDRIAATLSAILLDPPAGSVERALDELVLLLCEISAIEHRLAAAAASAP